jgi:arylsulfatase A-like enzyme
VQFAFRSLVLKQFLFFSPQYVWMAPAANLFILSLAGLALAALSTSRPRLVTVGRCVVALSFLCWAGFLTSVGGGVHHVALFVLAAGLAVSSARIVTTRPQGFQALIRRSSPWMCAGVVLATLGVHGSSWFGERERLAQLPAPLPGAPNVLLIVLDTVRPDRLSVYGYPEATSPQLAELAAGGAVFERAMATAPWTLPSHATMLTGRYPHDLSADWRTPLDDAAPTVAEVLSRHGYFAAGFVANAFYAGRESGLDRGFAHYEDYTVSAGQILNSSSLGQLVFSGRPNTSNLLRRLMFDGEIFGRKSAADINRDVLAWHASVGRRPYFAFINYLDAHAPYRPPAPFDQRFQGVGTAAGERAYVQAVAYLDDQVGRLLRDLRAQGGMENTVVIVTSDHGEQFGEHTLFRHGNSLYRQLLEVPLIVSFPGRIPAGVRVPGPVTLRDLAATMIDLTGVADARSIPGQSLRVRWQPADPSAPAGGDSAVVSTVSHGINSPVTVPVSRGDMVAIVADGWHYIRDGKGAEELYDFDRDVTEAANAAQAPAAAGTLLRMRELLRRMR